MIFRISRLVSFGLNSIIIFRMEERSENFQNFSKLQRIIMKISLSRTIAWVTAGIISTISLIVMISVISYFTILKNESNVYEGNFMF